MTTLKLKQPSILPLEAEAINPDRFLDQTETQIARLPVRSGKDPCELGDFFAVAGDGSPDITIEGDAANVKYIGAGMTGGKIRIEGSAGMHLGAHMRGGEIEVMGDACDWAGAELAGGLIRIHGNAGIGLGAGYRGSRRGMTRGRIIVDGNASSEAGGLMRRGLIVIGGDSGELTGNFMIAGTVIVFGRLGPRPGPGIKRGTLVTFHPVDLMPTYRYDCTYQPGFLRLILQSIRSQGVSVPGEYFTGSYRRYSGDFAALGKGEILVYDQH